MKVIIMLPALLVLVGCSSTPVSNSSDPPVRFSRYVQVAIYDPVDRPPTDKLTVLKEAPSGKYHTIATSTVDGEAQLEGRLINALAWKARQLGADAIFLQTPLHPHRNQWVFRADAIVTDREK